MVRWFRDGFKAISIILLALGLATPALAAKRVALVIGIGAYKHAAELTNPVNDADDMLAALRSVGFTTVEGRNLDKRALETKIREFAAALRGADTGVFFYAGHGLQVGGVNYLVPSDAELSTADALDFEMVRLDLVQRTMEREAKTNILFLDACRNNPLARNLARAMGTRGGDIGRGLAPAESGIGTLISFSTQPGNVALDGTGRNSPYSGPLTSAIPTAGEDILSILTAVRNEVLAATNEKQVPWENHALRGRFYFNTAARAPLSADAIAIKAERPAGKPRVLVFTHDEGLTPDIADQLKGAIASSEVDVQIHQHVDRRRPDAIYVSTIAPVELVRQIVDRVRQGVTHIFPVDYSTKSSMEMKGVSIAVGLMSDFKYFADNSAEKPYQISESQLRWLVEVGLDQTTFVERLKYIAPPRLRPE
jgi:uncharacterized caspase-like protein